MVARRDMPRRVEATVVALGITVLVTACSGTHRPEPTADPSRSTTVGSTTVTPTTATPGSAARANSTSTVAGLGQAAGCHTVTVFTPTKPASQGALCTFADGVTLNLLVFTTTADRDAVLKFNYSRTHVNGYGKNWTVLGLYDDLRPTSRRNTTVAADVTKATERAGGKVLK